MNTITIEATKRADLGRKSTKTLRNEGQIPCVLYGGENNVHFFAPTKSFKPVVYTPDFNVVELQVEGQNYKCVLKDLQFHPVSDDLLHLDFIELVDDKKVVVDLPLRFEGLASGVKAGGKLLAQMRKLRVKALPKDLVSEIKVDVTNLELGKSMKVKELDLGDLEIMSSLQTPMVSIEIPRSLRSKQASEATEE